MADYFTGTSRQTLGVVVAAAILSLIAVAAVVVTDPSDDGVTATALTANTQQPEAETSPDTPPESPSSTRPVVLVTATTDQDDPGIDGSAATGPTSSAQPATPSSTTAVSTTPSSTPAAPTAGPTTAGPTTTGPTTTAPRSSTSDPTTSTTAPTTSAAPGTSTTARPATAGDLSRFGYLQPNPGVNVGVPNGVRLEAYPTNGAREIVLSTDGQVIDGKRIDACIRITADNVTIRNSEIVCNGGGEEFDFFPVEVGSGTTGALVEYSSISCRDRGPRRENCRTMFKIDGEVTVQRNEFTGWTDIINVNGPASNHTLIAYNYYHSPKYACVGYAPDRQAHGDGLQQFAARVTVRGNYHEGWRGGDTATECNNDGRPKLFQATFVQSESFSRSDPVATIENNYYSGFWANIIHCTRGTCSANGNVIERDANLQSDGRRWVTIRATTASCNRWSDGSLINDFGNNTSNCG